MAFNWSTFRTRALTAVVFVAIMAAGLFWNEHSFLVLFSLVHFGGWREYRKLVTAFQPAFPKDHPAIRFGIPLGGWCVLLYFTHGGLDTGSLNLQVSALWAGAALLLLSPLLLLKRPVALGYALAGLLYLSLPLGLLVDLRFRPLTLTPASTYTSLNLVLPLLVIFSIWINDTMAYIVGSLIGKTPLSPISPKKTWEGTIGGALLAVAAMSAIAHFSGLLPVVHTAAISAIAAVTGTYGDLFESKLKRMAGVKDSGSFMPGHGGFLDRFDSLLFAATAVWVYVVLMF
ncbi:phosphatidate cytidylyltransferase [Flaviaesturariibacter amylovorans]|uniref:Phosphatidate cytidylyltransferase n=1 Tax=Flaviaesturariibacter amylovorans TaxID=1084520 RepID=A0ABP8HUV2_9BACT